MTDEPKAVCVTVLIVGALREQKNAPAQLSAFMQEVEAAMSRHFPDFLPGRPPVTVSWSEVSDDWIGRGRTAEAVRGEANHDQP